MNKTHTLKLYMGADDDQPFSRYTIPIDGTEVKAGNAYIAVSEDSELFDIPNGTNPRAVNPESPLVKKIRHTLENIPGFAVRNGGMCIVVDDGSLFFNKVAGTVSFSCDAEGCGHYDGQHSREAVQQGAANSKDQMFQIMFVERSFFPDDVAIRGVAESWNDRSKQKPHSEINQRGSFEDFRSSLSPVHVANIGWRENERNSNGEIIRKECNMGRVAALLYTAAPVLRSAKLDLGDTMYGMLRKGDKAAEIFEDAEKVSDFKRIYPFADTILELHDYIQTTLRTGYAKNAQDPQSIDDLAILRSSNKTSLNKPVAKRKQLSQMLFNATTVEVGLMPEYIQPIMYGLLRNVLKTNGKTGEVRFQQGITIDDVKAIWDEAAYDVLTMLNDAFEANFTTRFNSRRAEFGCWSHIWDECFNIIEEVVDFGAWRPVSQAAAK
jgi:hypothetical protein